MTPVQRDADRGPRAARWIVRVGLGGGAVCLLVGAAFYLGAGPAGPAALPQTRAEDTDSAVADALPAVPLDDPSRRPGEEVTGGVGATALAPASEAPQAPPDEEGFDAPVEGRLPTDAATDGAGTAGLRQAPPDASLGVWAAARLLAALKHLAPAGFVVLGTMLVSVGAVFALLDRLGVLAAVAARPHGMEAPEPHHDLPSPEWRNGDSTPVRNGPAEAPASPDGGAGPRGAQDGEPRSIPVWSGVTIAPQARGSAPAEPANPATFPATDPGPPGAEGNRGAEPGRVRETAPAYGEAAGGAASGRGGPHGTRAAGPGSDEAGRNASTDGAGPAPHHATATATAPGGVTKPDPDVQSPKPYARLDEATASSRPVDEPPPPEPPQPGDLIDAWDEYRRNGDGHFSPRGLQEVLDHWGFDARVGHGDRVGAGGAVLLVEASGTPNFYVLPSFNKSPRAVAEWFDDHSGGALTGRTQRVARVARGRWPESGTGRCEVVERGEIR